MYVPTSWRKMIPCRAFYAHDLRASAPLHFLILSRDGGVNLRDRREFCERFSPFCTVIERRGRRGIAKQMGFRKERWSWLVIPQSRYFY